MESQDRLAHLESVRDWHELRDELEREIAGATSNDAKARLHIHLGRVLDQRFLNGARALKHFQDAYKLSPALIESLEDARRIYWELGKLNMVQKLLELELKAAPDSSLASQLLLELADVLCDLDQYDLATSTYARALGVSPGGNAAASASLEDVQVTETDWDGRVADLVRAAHARPDGKGVREFLRAARLLRRFQGPAAAEGVLRQAYRADPIDSSAATLFEGLLAEQKRLDELEATQRELIAAEGDNAQKARLALEFGRRWSMRHQNLDIAAKFLEEALTREPANHAAFNKLVEIYGSRERWTEVLSVADRALDASKDLASASHLLSQAGSVAWRHAGDLMRARGYFSRLAGLAPDDRELVAFERQIGEKLPRAPVGGSHAPRAASTDTQGTEVSAVTSTSQNGRSADEGADVGHSAAAAAADLHSAPGDGPSPATAGASDAGARDPSGESSAKGDSTESAAAPETPIALRAAAGEEAGDAGAAPIAGSAPSPAQVPVAVRPAAAAAAPTHTPDDAKAAELRAQLAKFETAKRWGEVAKTLIALTAVLSDDGERVSSALRAADIYANQLRNQVEAIKAYELVRSIAPDTYVAFDFLIKAYETRREFEKLLNLRRQSVAALPIGPERAARFTELARLATEKVKKPDVCIAYWREVVESDPQSLEAVSQLAGFYERAKDFGELAKMLEREVELTADRAKRITTLRKLGTIYGDRLQNDAGAVEAWQALLAIDQNDKLAQEALKKKYIALHRWDDLEGFYLASGKWDELIRILEQQEAREGEASVKAGLLFKIAQVWADRKQKVDRASKAYERILELDPANLRAAESLIPIYQQLGSPAALARPLEVKLQHATERTDRIALLRELAGLYERNIDDPGRALERYRSAFELAPDDPALGGDFERLARRTERWDYVVADYRGAIESASDPLLARALRLRLGRVLVDETQRIDDALVQFRAVYEEDPENDTALSALERLYRQTERYKDLLSVYEKKREVATDPDEQRRILYAIAQLNVRELGRPEHAVATYHEVLTRWPDDATALAALDDLYKTLAEWPAYADVLRRRLELDVPEATLLDLKFRLALVLEQHLGDPRGALDNHREILQLDASHEGARVELERMLSIEDVSTEVAGVLEAIYESRGDWEQLVRVLGILAAHEPDLEKRVELLRKSARTSMSMLGDAAGAFDSQARALAISPANFEARSELEELAATSGAHEKLVEALSGIAEVIDDPVVRRDYLLRIGALQDRSLGRVDAAAASYHKVLEAHPADGEALSALEQLYSRTGRWADLVDVLQRRIALSEDASARESLYARTASIYEDRLGRPEDAIGCYREVLASDPTSEVALAALEGLYERQEKWTDLAENIETQIRLAAMDEEQLALMQRLARLRESRMGEVEQAIDLYRQVLDREPASAEALAALERIGRDPEHELVIADLLEPYYKSLGDWRKLVGVYEIQVARSEDRERRVELLQQIAQLYEDHGSEPGAAFDALSRALADDPARDSTLAALHRLASVTDRWADLARVLDERAAAVSDPQLASALQMSSARVHEESLRDGEGAVSRYGRVLDLDPASLAAAESLERLFHASERWTELSAILLRKSEIVEALADKKQALFAAASIEEDILQRPEQAILVYHRALELDPEDERALEALMKHFLELRRWEDLLRVYERKVDLVVDVDDKRRVLYQMGSVWERELRDPARAIETYQRVLDLDPTDSTALGRLDVLYQSSESWTELLGILQRESDLSADPGDTISYQYRISELYETRLGDVPRAVELYREILDAEPSHGPTIQRLEALKDGDAEPIAAAAVLEPIYEGEASWPRLISVLEVQVKHAQDPLARVDLLHRIARLYDDHLQETNRAFDTYARALNDNNADPNTLAALEAIADRTNRWRDVGRLYDAQLDALLENAQQFVDLGIRDAEIFEVQLSDFDGAVVRYRRVIDVDPENQSAIRSLDRLFGQLERWSDLATVLAREAEIGETPDEILELKYRLGEVHERRLGDLDRAIGAYRDVLAVEPEHERALARLEAIFASGQKQPEVAEILEPLYRQFDQFEKLAGVYEAQLQHLTDPQERLAMYYRIAELHEEKLADGTVALSVHTRAFREAPLDERAHEEAERLAGTLASFDTLANSYADVLAENQDPEVVRFVGAKLAKTFEDQLGDQQKAEETYRYVLGVDPLDATALENLDRIYVQWGSAEQLANIIVQRTRATPDRVELVELFARLGQVYEEALGRPGDAIAAFRKIFDDLDRTHEGAIAALARLYAEKDSPHELLEVYERELQNAVGDVQEAEIQAKIADLVSERLGDVPRAIDIWKRVLDLRGEDPDALQSLAALYEREQQWPELVDVLERQADAATDEGARAAFLSRRARIFSEKLRRDDLALDEWHRVLDINFEHVAALRAIADIRRRQNDPAELVMSLHNIVERAARLLDEDELKAIFRELGKTYGEVLDQPIEAADAWRKLLEVDPSDFDAMAALEAIHRRDEQWTDVIAVKLQRATALGDRAEKVRELFEVSDLWHERVGEPDGATEANARVLEIEPANDRAFQALERLHTDAERWDKLAELYVQRLELTEEVPSREELYRKIARVLDERLDDATQAFEVLVNAFSEDFDDDASVVELERMAQKTQRWADLLNTANAWLKDPAILADAPRQISLMLRLAKWYGEDIGKPEWAMPYFQQVQRLDPHNVRVIRQVASLYRKAGNFDQVGQTLTNALEIATVEKDRKEICVDLGDLLERQKGQVDQAIVYYQRALDIDPAYEPAIEALERIYSARGAVREIVEMLERKVAARGDTTELNATRTKLAGMYVQQVNDLGRAGELYRDALESDPTNVGAMRGLQVVYQRTQDWPRLLQLLEAELEAVQTERERVDVLLQLAAVLEEHFIKPDLAAQRLEQALEIDPNNDAAYRAVERCYAKLRRWHDLVAAYDRHVSSITDDASRIEVYAAMGKTYADELDDVDRGVEAYRNIIDLDPNNVAALEALSRLYEKQGETASALDTMARVADLTLDSQQKVDMLHRIGKAHDEKLGDRLTAQEKFRAALDLDPTHLPSLAALRQIALDTADWYEAGQLLEQEQTHTIAPRPKAKLLVELGRLREEMLGDHDGAIAAFQSAYDADPESEDAANPLATEFVQSGAFDKAEPLLDLLTRKAAKRDRAEQHRLFGMYGKALAALGKNDRALKAYQQSFQADPTDMEVIRGLADVSYDVEDWPAALSNYQKVLTSLGDEDREVRTEVYFRIGSIKRRQGQARQAITNYEKALEIDAAHRPTLEALVQVFGENKDWKQVVEYKRQILDNVIEGDERFRILVEIGDIWADNDKNVPKAIEALEEALELQPDDHVVLHKLLQHYQAVGNWPKMVESIERIAALEANPERKAKYFYTMAQLYRDKEDDADRAVEYFNLALDNDPTFLKAFEAINKILTTQRNWKGLERAYRKMLHRSSGRGQSELEFSLWHGLGLIYRDRLGQRDAGIEAFRMSSRIKPEEMQERQILAELYEQNGQVELAVSELQDVLQHDSMRVDPYQALYKLYMKAGMFDRAWCIAAALAFLKKADAEQQAFFEERRPKGMQAFRARLDNEAWVKGIFHAEQDKILGKIFEMITPAARTAKLLQLRAARQLPELPRKFLQDPATTTITFAKAFFGATQLLSLPAPALYVRNDVPGQLTVSPTDPPASVAGASVLSGYTPQELMFLIGKHLTYYRGEHYLKTLFPSLTELKTLLLTAVKIAVPDFPLPADMEKGVLTTAQELAKYMQPIQFDGLRLVVKHFIDAGAKADIKRWMQTSDVTAIRAGFVLCGDLDMSAKLIRAEQVVAGDLSPSEKLKELIQYAVSEQYFTIRQTLGLAMQ